MTQTTIKSVLIHYGINVQIDGLSTVTVNEAGDVLSVQPDGTFETRPKGTADAYEKGRVSGNLIVFKTPDAPIPFVVVALAQAV